MPRVSQPDDSPDLAQLMITMGCPEAKAGEMASQLAKRSRQLAVERNIPREEATAHLLSLMRQGWAAKQQNDAD